MILVNRCLICKSELESVDHLLLHFLVTRHFWGTALGFIGISWVLPHKVRGMLAPWEGHCGRKPKLEDMSLIPFIIFLEHLDSGGKGIRECLRVESP